MFGYGIVIGLSIAAAIYVFSSLSLDRKLILLRWFFVLSVFCLNTTFIISAHLVIVDGLKGSWPLCTNGLVVVSVTCAINWLESRSGRTGTLDSLWAETHKCPYCGKVSGTCMGISLHPNKEVSH